MFHHIFQTPRCHLAADARWCTFMQSMHSSCQYSHSLDQSRDEDCHSTSEKAKPSIFCWPRKKQTLGFSLDFGKVEPKIFTLPEKSRTKDFWKSKFGGFSLGLDQSRAENFHSAAAIIMAHIKPLLEDTGWWETQTLSMFHWVTPCRSLLQKCTYWLTLRDPLISGHKGSDTLLNYLKRTVMV